MSAGAVIGREEELGEIRACLTAAAEGPPALTLAGEPGIGKTVLWEAGVEDARERGYRVLVHRSVRGRGGLRVRRAVGSRRAGLRRGRRRAGGAAACGAGGRAAARDADDTRRRSRMPIGLALLDVLRLLARGAPVLVALDDLQWLDPSSASVLPAALRRLDGTSASGVLATTRERGRRDLAAWGPRGCACGRWSPLGIGGAPRTAARRGSAWSSRDRSSCGCTRCPAATRSSRWSSRRHADGDACRRACAICSAAASPRCPPETADVLLLGGRARSADGGSGLRRARGPVTARAALEAAGRRTRQRRRGGCASRIPLLGVAVLRARGALPPRATPTAGSPRSVADVEERARHLALAATEPDASVAAELDAASAPRLRAAQLSPLPSWRSSRRSARRRTTPRRGRRRRLAAGAPALARRGSRSAPRDPRRARSPSYPAGRRARRPAARRWRSAAGSTSPSARRPVRAGHRRGGRRRRAGDRAARPGRDLPLVPGGHAAGARRRARRASRGPSALGDPRLLVIAQGRARDPRDMGAATSRPGCSRRQSPTEATLDEPLPFYQSPRFALAARHVPTATTRPAGRAILGRTTPATGDDHTHGFAHMLLVARGMGARRTGTPRARHARAVRSSPPRPRSAATAAIA